MAATRISLGQRRHSGGDTDWMMQGDCRAEEPELFFPLGDGLAAQQQTTEAKTVCGYCPVISECLEWALDSGQDHGIWGGKTEDERRVLKRQRFRTHVRTGS